MSVKYSYALVSLISTIVNEYKKWPMLIIVPSTTLGNWAREFEDWAPEIHVAVLGGTSHARKMIRDNEIFSEPKSKNGPLKVHAVIASYEHLILNDAFYTGRNWEVLVCDEGHRLKNSEGAVFKAMKTIKATQRIVLTGTPYLLVN